MSELREIENPNAMGINAIYYKGEKKREFLANKMKILRRIPKKSVLGFVYTINGIEVHDGESMDDADYSNNVTE